MDSPLARTYFRKDLQNSDRQYAYLSAQVRPDTASPVLNVEELEREIGKHLETDDLIASRLENIDLTGKLESLLRNNSQLLNENATLSELVNSLRTEIELAKCKEREGVFNAGVQTERLCQELKLRELHSQSQYERLIAEISRLQQQCCELQMTKSAELKIQRETQQRQHALQIHQIRRSADDARQICEMQIRRLKETLQMKDFELESLKSELKAQAQSLKGEVRTLQAEIKHGLKKHELQLKEVEANTKNEIANAIRNAERQRQFDLSQRDAAIKKLKRDILGKNNQLEHTAKKASTEVQQIHDELHEVREQAQVLREKIQNTTVQAQQRIDKERQRITTLTELEKSAQSSLFENEKQSLLGDRERLKILCSEKSEEIKRIFAFLQEIKGAHLIQKNSLQSIIEELRLKLRQVEEMHLAQIELLKVKCAQLHQADIVCLQKYHQTQLQGLTSELLLLRENSASDREKVHKLLIEREEQRKQFEIELAKQKAKLQDMRVKFAAARVEFKEQINSFGTKMELTSQTLLREAEQKQRGAEFFEAQSQKYQNIIDAKQKQNQVLEETLHKVKDLASQDALALKLQIQTLKESASAQQQQFKKRKSELEANFEAKRVALLSTPVGDPDEELMREVASLRTLVSELEKELYKSQREVEFNQKQKGSLLKQIGLKAGHLEALQLESSAAIEEERSKSKQLLSESEIVLKEHYEPKIKNLGKEILALKQRLVEKDADLRAVNEKYTRLEGKLAIMLDKENQLREMEKSIVEMGVGNNVAKNWAQVWGKRKEGEQRGPVGRK